MSGNKQDMTKDAASRIQSSQVSLHLKVVVGQDRSLACLSSFSIAD
jgi:hypothetical protein